MGLKIKSCKKNAMALIGVLVLITSLAVVIASSIKVLSVANNYSINRIAKKGTDSAKATGKFICYKKLSGSVFKLYQQRIDYNPDGSYTPPTETDVTDKGYCEFTVPQGVDNFKLTLVGAGGKGGDSSYTIGSYEINCNNIAKEPIQQDANYLDCKSAHNKLKTDVIFSAQVDVIYNNELNCGYSNGLNNEFPAISLGDFLSVERDTQADYDNWYNQISSTNSENVKIGKTDMGNKYCEVDFSYVNMNEDEKNHVSISKTCKIDNTPIICGNYASIISQLNNINYITHYTRTYNIQAGSPGSPSCVKVFDLPGEISGDNDSNRNIIKISSNDIGDSKNGGATTFRYWYKNYVNYANEYESKFNTAAAGEAGAQPLIPRIVRTNIEPIASQDGIVPFDLTIPSIFANLDNLYAGYENKPATYFGASGASGALNFPNSDFISKCWYTKFDNNNKQFVNQLCSDISTNSVTTHGSDGAPGAVMISW